MTPPRLVQPFESIQVCDLTTLIGPDQQVDQNEYGPSVEVELQGELASGEILLVGLYTDEAGSGAVLSPAGLLLIFDSDPGLSAGDTALVQAADHTTVIAHIAVSAFDWKTDSTGGRAFIFDKPVPFQALDSLYVAWFHEDATSFNDAAGDDERLRMKFWYRRDS
jgi:hypothetical protein